jgi:hypothetical protein
MLPAAETQVTSGQAYARLGPMSDLRVSDNLAVLEISVKAAKPKMSVFALSDLKINGQSAGAGSFPSVSLTVAAPAAQ